METDFKELNNLKGEKGHKACTLLCQKDCMGAPPGSRDSTPLALADEKWRSLRHLCLVGLPSCPQASTEVLCQLGLE